MTAHNFHYCFTLSEGQLEYLRSKKYKIDRMECFMSLVKLAELETKLVQISKVQQVEILPGQVMIDNTQLAKLWNKDRKTVPKIREAMEALGISSSQKVGENRIHTLHSLSGWYVDGEFVGNKFALKRNTDHTAIIHADVPPARMITIEMSDDKISREEISISGCDKSTFSSEGKNSSADNAVTHPSPQSNNSADVGKSGSDGLSSLSPSDNIPHPYAGIPSSAVEADGCQNVGKRNEEASPLQSGGHGGQYSGYQEQPYNGVLKSKGNYTPDDNK